MSLNANSVSFNPNASSFVPGQFGGGGLDDWESAWSPPSNATTEPSPATKSKIPATTPTPAPTPAPSPVVESKLEAPVIIAAPVTEPAAPKPASPPLSPSPGPEEETVDDARETHKERKERLEAEAEATLEALDDPREHLSIVFIGHVDAGKSTISGQVLFSTGMVDERTIQKYEREAIEKNRSSWFLAYIMDTNEEERAKGKTVEVGRAHFATERKRYTILDAPGHKNYVPNMITGVAQADIGILVISARKGEFEAGFTRSGQTREHAILAKTLGITRLVVVVNKMDESTVGWSKERYDDIQSKLTPFLKSVGYNVKTEVTFLPISGYTGANLARQASETDCPWYRGPHLLDILDSLTPLERMDQLSLRIPVLDKYKEGGKTYILGKVEAGVLRSGEEICLRPGDIKLIVGQIQNDSNIITVARPGEMVKLICKMSQLDEDAITKGCVIQHNVAPFCPVTDEFVAQIVIMEVPEHKGGLFTAGYKSVLHIHTATEEVEVLLLLEEIDPKTGKTKTRLPKFVKEKAVVVCHFKATRAIPMEAFKDYAQLGRFTLRDETKTIAFGKILGTRAPVKRLKQQ